LVIATKYTSISVLPETRARLNALGKKGQTYDDIIAELINKCTRGAL
jgi:predicted DNA-binding protein